MLCTLDRAFSLASDAAGLSCRGYAGRPSPPSTRMPCWESLRTRRPPKCHLPLCVHQPRPTPQSLSQTTSSLEDLFSPNPLANKPSSARPKGRGNTWSSDIFFKKNNNKNKTNQHSLIEHLLYAGPLHKLPPSSRHTGSQVVTPHPGEGPESQTGQRHSWATNLGF